ncbi:hypothetical protein JCM3765_001968 [Sporobolomyces pararoseus]
MGCCGSTSQADDASKTSQEIDEELRRSKKEFNSVIKTLLLGPGESGKSTLVKQMRLVYSRPYSPEDCREYKEIVFSNTLQSMQVVLHGFGILKIDFPPQLDNAAILLENLEVDSAICPTTGDFEIDVAQAIKSVWEHPSTRKVLSESNRLQLNDSATYFFDAIARTSQVGYVPSDADILRCRVRSTGIVEETFQVGSHKLVVLDVGGQRSDVVNGENLLSLLLPPSYLYSWELLADGEDGSRSRVSCFEGVQLLIFVASLSEFDQVLYEDQEQPRMEESLLLWQSIASSPWFSRTSLILFLNKIDLLEKKVRTRPDLVEYFLPDYLGPPDDPEGVKVYFHERFNRVHGAQERPLFCHFTTATDTSAMRPIFRAVMESVITSSLAEGGFL